MDLVKWLVVAVGIAIVGWVLLGLEVPAVTTEDVWIDNGDVRLAGTLSLPPGPGPHPAVVLVSGSGPQDRDEAMPGIPDYRPFAVIAEHLAEQDVAVLRYDDRGVGESTGDNATASTGDLATDAEAVFAYLRNRSEIDATRVGIFGHSEGAMIAAMIAARNPNVAFVVSMGGSAADNYELLLRQEERIVEASEMNEAEKAESMAMTQTALELTRDANWPELETFLRGTVVDQIAGIPEERRAALGDLDTFTDQAVEQTLAHHQNWLHFFLTYDVAADWATVDVPVLVLLGGLDTQVDAVQARESFQTAFAQGGNERVSYAVFPQANHLFLTAETGHPDEYAPMDKAFVPGFLETVSDWVLAVVDELGGSVMLWRETLLPIAFLLIAGGAVLIHGFHQQMGDEVDALLQAIDVSSPKPVSTTDYEAAPAPVQRYFQAVGIEGQPVIRSVRLKQHGQMRTSPDSNWIPIEAEQYISTDPPGFVWLAKTKIMGIFPMWVRDKFTGGHGEMWIKPLGLIMAGRSAGPEIDQGTMLRYLAEMAWFPTALLPSEHLQWEAIDDRSARTVFTVDGQSVAATFEFGADGLIERVEAQRYYDTGDGYDLTRWSGIHTDYRTVDGLQIPTGAELTWHLDGGDFTWLTLEITDIEFNPPRRY